MIGLRLFFLFCAMNKCRVKGKGKNGWDFHLMYVLDA